MPAPGRRRTTRARKVTATALLAPSVLRMTHTEGLYCHARLPLVACAVRFCIMSCHPGGSARPGPLPRRRPRRRLRPRRASQPCPLRSLRIHSPLQIKQRPAPSANIAADPKKQERLQKIRQLTFDRRPSSILKAWSTPREVGDQTSRFIRERSQANPAPRWPARRFGLPVASRAQTAGVLAGVTMPAGTNAAGTNAAADPFDLDLRGFQYDVTRGDWKAVKTFVARLPEDEGKAAYEQLIAGLSNPQGAMANNPQLQMQMQMQQQQMQMRMNMGMGMNINPNAPPPQQFMMERCASSNQDVFDLAWAAPHGLDDERLTGLGRLLRLSLDTGNVIEDFITRLRAILKRPLPRRP